MLFPSCNKIVVGKVFFEMIISFLKNKTILIILLVKFLFQFIALRVYTVVKGAGHIYINILSPTFV